MKVSAEVFRGIEFVRISNLPEDQREFITASIPSDNIIKILKDKVVMKDCIQYKEYLALYNLYTSVQPVANQNKQLVSQQYETNYKFAFR